MDSIKELLNKFSGVENLLKIPFWWIKRILNGITEKVEETSTTVNETVSKVDTLLSKVSTLLGEVSTLRGNLGTTKMELQSVLNSTKTDLQNKDNDLDAKKVSMTYLPKSNSVLLRDGNGCVQLFGNRIVDNKVTVKVKDGVTSVYIFGRTCQVVNGEYTYELELIATSYENMFGGVWDKGQENIIYISPFISPNITNMYYMFRKCSSLTSLDLSNFDTSAVTSMNGMFFGCSSLTSLDLSNFDTSAVTDMIYMFRNCTSLVSLDLSNFDTSAVTSMNSMFDGCTALKNIKCKLAFKDWCVANASTIKLTVSNITWEIVE